MREGSLEAPTRHPLDWKNDAFWNPEDLNTELERVFDICHGCRRCVSLCDSFPTLFDLIDGSETMEIDGVEKLDFRKSLGKVAWHAPCHQLVENIGSKTREVLDLIDNTEVTAIERCSGHDAIYGVSTETYEKSKKIAGGTVSRIKRLKFDYFASDCPMAPGHLGEELDLKHPETNPITLLRIAYCL